MESQPVSDFPQPAEIETTRASSLKILSGCVAGVFIPGLGHALLGKWDRAVVFFGSITLMVVLGLQLQGRLFNPDLSDIFSTLKFAADAGSGLLYWIPWLRGMGTGDPTAYTYDYANLFIYVAGLLNMLVVIDVFDIAMGRKR